MTDASGEQSQTPNKAALLAMVLHKDVLAKVLKHLSETEITRLIEIYEYEKANPANDQARLLEVGKEFIAASAHDASGHFKEALVLALGEESAAQIMRQDRWRVIATRVRPAALAELLKDERPEAIGIVLAKLPPRYSAEVLQQLPTLMCAQSIERLSRGTAVPSAASDALACAIEESLNAEAGANDQGGNQTAAAMLNQLDAEAAFAIIEQIRTSAPDRALAIEHQMFHFENLLTLDARMLERVLGAVQTDRLTLALKGVAVDQREILMGALTDQVKLMVTQELEDAGAVPASEIKAARRAITNLALQMEREGKIRLHADQQEMIS